VKAIAARTARSRSPYGAMVEISDHCNEACVHCYQVQGQKGELDTEHWKRILDDLAALGVLFLTISGGEPTLRKDFLELVSYARQLKFAVKIYSNALNISEALATELGRLAVQEVQISLYSHRAEVHDSITRVPGSFEQICSAVRFLRNAGVRVLLKSPLMQANEREFSEYIEFVTCLGADYRLDPKLNPREDGDFAPAALGVSKATYLAAQRDPRLVRPRPTVQMPLDDRPCGACVGNVHVEPNGEMRPCTQWSIPTGHALGAGLQQSWHNDPVATAIRSLRWADLPACRVCDLRDHCQRCFAEAEHYTGSALAAYTRACQGARWKYESESGVEPEIDSLDGFCDAIPVGPFRRAGGHRFIVERSRVDSATVSRPPDRSWLPDVAKSGASPHMGAAGLVQIRRSKAAPLTPMTPPPSDQ
jgi:radical SAM protein with 4Fe4S-binding SPASM domain